MNEKDKIAYELYYWEKAGMEEVDEAYYMDYLKQFGLELSDFDDKIVLDAGCGPKGGITYVVHEHAKELYALDPLFAEYSQANILRLRDGVNMYYRHTENLDKTEKFDMVFSCNALDHNTIPGKDNLDIAFEELYESVKPGGWMYIWVHLRKPEELNDGHDFCVTEARMLKLLLDFKLEASTDVRVYDKYDAIFINAYKPE